MTTKDTLTARRDELRAELRTSLDARGDLALAAAEGEASAGKRLTDLDKARMRVRDELDTVEGALAALDRRQAAEDIGSQVDGIAKDEHDFMAAMDKVTQAHQIALDAARAYLAARAELTAAERAAETVKHRALCRTKGVDRALDYNATGFSDQLDRTLDRWLITPGEPASDITSSVETLRRVVRQAAQDKCDELRGARNIPGAA